MNRTSFKEIFKITSSIIGDNRGHLYVLYDKPSLNIDFVQDNISYSKLGTIRGLHFQKDPFCQGKLIHVIDGNIIDYQVDIRKDSHTFGKFDQLILKNGESLYIPPGFAHGFEVISDSATILYKNTRLYNKEHEVTLSYKDKDINIKWQTKTPILSEKDKNGISLKEYEYTLNS